MSYDYMNHARQYPLLHLLFHEQRITETTCIKQDNLYSMILSFLSWKQRMNHEYMGQAKRHLLLLLISNFFFRSRRWEEYLYQGRQYLFQLLLFTSDFMRIVWMYKSWLYGSNKSAFLPPPPVLWNSHKQMIQRPTYSL